MAFSTINVGSVADDGTGDPVRTAFQKVNTNFALSTAAGYNMFTALNVAAQTALLNAFVGDSGSGGTAGLVPAPAAGDAASTKFLKADGTWQPANLPVSVSNFLPNCQWQLWSALSYVTKMNAAGTASQTAVSCTGFDVANGQPNFYTTNTQALRAGDLVVVSGGGFQWGYAGVGYVSTATAARVVRIVTNTSVVVQGNFGAVTPASSTAVTLTPITPGDTGSGTGQCADGWKKSTTLTVWADDFSANAYPGAIRTLGIRKDSASTRNITWTCSSKQLAKYAGRQITFGVLVYQKVKGGSGTWRVFSQDDSGTTFSSAAAGAGFQFLSVTAIVSATTTAFTLGIEFNGNSGDVYYVALPTAVFGSVLAAAYCGQNPDETMRPVGHWNPPLLTPFNITFPNSAFVSSLYGWSGVDLEAISLGQCHKSVEMVKCKIEWLTNTVGAYIFTGSRLDYSLIFGPQAITQVSAVNDVGQGWLPLADDGTFCLFTGTSGLVPTSATFDFDVVQLSMTASIN